MERWIIATSQRPVCRYELIPSAIDLILDHVTNERVALKSAEYSLSQRPMQHHVLIPSAPDLVRDYVASERVALRRAKY